MEIEDRGDSELARRAFAHGWITDHDVRVDLRKQLERIVLDPKASARDKTSAIKALISAERIALTEREVELKERTAGVLGDESDILALLQYIDARKTKATEEA